MKQIFSCRLFKCQLFAIYIHPLSSRLLWLCSGNYHIILEYQHSECPESGIFIVIWFSLGFQSYRDKFPQNGITSFWSELNNADKNLNPEYNRWNLVKSVKVSLVLINVNKTSISSSCRIIKAWEWALFEECFSGAGYRLAWLEVQVHQHLISAIKIPDVDAQRINCLKLENKVENKHELFNKLCNLDIFVF